ncbi:hypothetical protein EDD37DRAFT_603480 [Exophiala viscosa]|uniref:uncharacterized protein n=1 Tax=Exophiala viscosa TaxID=2486360 RepID=UPI0021940189|nr:hypothetical protein EDD37DRAFT_603480 [Exophiala viscosa]
MSSTVLPVQTQVDAPSDGPRPMQQSDLVMESAAPTVPAPAPASVPAPATEDVVMSTSPTTAAAVPSVSKGTIPLDSSLRTTPIHPSLPGIKVSGGASPNTNPLTLQPFTEAELAQHGYTQLRTQFTPADKEELARLRAETAALLKQRLDKRESKMRDIQREMDEKEKIREVERKVFRKKLDAMKGK